ncbi:hypothetical protein [uncultured Jannaschia sp.]|uniref:phosphorylase family protein n=1 Tax=uncultured Jannaschia sp. TaxID=293347 RepID=UPI00262F04DA|nr:hypothetical protein [uncultured Jannaschia sp.]
MNNIIKKHFDIIVNIPLEEELQAFLNVFDHTEDLSTETQYRCVVDTTCDLTMLVVLQDEMGKSSASNSITETLQEYSCNLFICLGIAGALSKDVKLGDVCYSGNILDVYDNTKTTDGRMGAINLELSPFTYRTDKRLSLAIDFARRDPTLKSKYNDWQESRLQRAAELLISEVPDVTGKSLQKAEPKSVGGTIVCGAVSAGNNYNEKIKNLDRKVLAIETESGGIFNVAHRKGIQALTIRGISDYADSNKEKLESKTKDAVRVFAAENAASFLKFHLRNRKFTERIQESATSSDTNKGVASQSDTGKSLEDLVIGGQNFIDSRLRELSPEYRLHAKGYQMPLPSLIPEQSRKGGSIKGEPVHDIIECLKTEDHIYIALDKNYPDKSVPWVIADHLIRNEIDGVQLLPVVVDGDSVKPPHYSIELAAPDVFSYPDETIERQVVIIFDGLPLSSRTRAKFILEQVNQHKSAKFVFIDRTEANFFMQSEFASALSAAPYRLCEVSFSQIAYFVQRNFEMGTSESEVIAKRLRDTFHKFQLNAHPAYFAGIPKETLSALIQANRRTELMQLGVDGFMTFLVAGDQATITLSRTTRSKFLRQLVLEIHVNKRSFTEADLISYTSDFAKFYDFDIKPISFIEEFVKTGILFFDNECVRVAIPFIESFLLAQELAVDNASAKKYFSLDDYDFDLGAFDLYCEIQPSPEIVDSVIELLENTSKDYSLSNHILLSDRIDPGTLLAMDKLGALQGRIEKAVKDIGEDKSATVEKQRLLDITERVTERASKSSAAAFDAAEVGDGDTTTEEGDVNRERFDARVDEISKLAFASMIGTILVGHGAEHLSAEKKRILSALVIRNASILIDQWTNLSNEVDFTTMKSDLTSQEFIDEIMLKYPSDTKMERIKSTISDYVDFMKFIFVSTPFREVIGGIGDHGRNPILGKSLRAVVTHDPFSELVRSIWLADLELGYGDNALSKASKDLPKSSLLRICVSEHLLRQVYWTHAKKDHRLKLLDIAENMLRKVDLSIDSSKIKKDIDNEV